jgi:hypothetical protein
VGYVEDKAIYSFGGYVLGYYDGKFVYGKNGDTVGASDPKALGTDAAAKQSVTKAGKQAVPEKQLKAVTLIQPRLKNRYIGGSLRDVFQ